MSSVPSTENMIWLSDMRMVSSSFRAARRSASKKVFTGMTQETASTGVLSSTVFSLSRYVSVAAILRLFCSAAKNTPERIGREAFS